VSEQFLNHSDIGATLKKMGRKGVPQSVRGNVTLQLSGRGGIANYLPSTLPRQPPSPLIEENRRGASSGCC
jgi:hypothetical protein